MSEIEDFIRRYTATWASREPLVMANLWQRARDEA